jgi:hypothetical protein
MIGILRALQNIKIFIYINICNNEMKTQYNIYNTRLYCTQTGVVYIGDNNCTESVGPRVIYRQGSFQNECILAVIIAPISTQSGIYGL